MTRKSVCNEPLQCYANMSALISRISPVYANAVLDVLLAKLGQLDVDSLRDIDVENVHIWQHPVGQLYNTAVIDKLAIQCPSG